MPAACVVGVDLGGTKLLAGALNADRHVLARVTRRVRGLDQAALLEAVAGAVEDVRDETGADVEAVGFGIPALIDQTTGVAVSCVHLPLAGVAFGARMAERLGLPVVVENDANAAVLAEHRLGAARGAGHVVMLTIGTGIGSGLILGGELYRGAQGAAAELGHTVIDIDGPPCNGNCPNRGCLEAIASGTALEREARRLAGEQRDSALAAALARDSELDGEVVTALAHDGDPAAREAIALIGERLGVGIASFVNALNPDVVVVGGGVAAAGELLLEPARRGVAERALAPSRDHARILLAELGPEAGMVGAGLMALERAGAPAGAGLA